MHDTNENKGTYVHKFTEPFTWDGITYETLSFQWSKLKGADMLAIEAELRDLDIIAIVPQLSGDFLCRMAAKAGNLNHDVLEAMPIRDFAAIRNKAKGFLSAVGLL